MSNLVGQKWIKPGCNVEFGWSEMDQASALCRRIWLVRNELGQDVMSNLVGQKSAKPWRKSQVTSQSACKISELITRVVLRWPYR